MMMLEGSSLCITEDRSKREDDSEDCWLVSKNVLQLFPKGDRTDR